METVQRVAASIAPFLEPLSQVKARLEGIHLYGFVHQYLVFAALGLVLLLIIPAIAEQRRGRGIWSSLFPKAIYVRRSTLTDILFAVLGGLLSIPLTAMVPWLTADSVQALWQHHFPQHEGIALSRAVTIGLQFSVIFLARDFASYFRHYLSHKVPVLWAFHRVHHSAEVLTPLMGGPRKHPVEFFWEGLSGAWLSGLLIGTAFFACGMKVDATAAAMLSVLAIYQVTQVIFCHSHIWISYGPLDRFIMSPCMHIVHHSALLKHRDKNLGGGGLSLWDWLFGTLYVPTERETFPLGLNLDARGEYNPHINFVRALTEPFVEFMHVMTGKSQSANSQESNSQEPHISMVLSDGTHAMFNRKAETLVASERLTPSRYSAEIPQAN